MRHFLYFALSLLLVCAVPLVSAQAESDEKKRPAVLKAKITPIESLGVFTTPQQGSLGRDLWSNGDRRNISALMSALPSKTENYALQRLRNGILLTAANTQLLKDKDPAQDGADMFTLRLENLLRIGAYDYAAKMYEKLDDEPYHPRLAKAGIITLMLQGEKALGCLEYKTVADRDFSEAAEKDTFWGDIALYCDFALKTGDESKVALKALKGADNKILKNIAVNSNYKTNYSKQRFQKMDLFSKAILKADDRILKSNLTSINFNDLPPSHIELLYSEDDVESNPRTPMLLNIQRLRWGYTDALQVRSFFQRNKKVLNKGEATGWRRIPSFYQKMDETTSEEEKLNVFSNHLHLKKSYGTAVFLPVIKHLRDIEEDNLNNAQRIGLIRIFHHAGLNWPSKWTKNVLENAKTPLGGTTSQRLFAVSVNNLSANKIEKGDIEQFNSILDKNKVIQEEILKIVIEKLDKPLTNNHNHIKVYEKDALTSPVRTYSLPHQSLWNGLRQAGNGQSISEVLLLTTLIMHDLQGIKIYPGIMQDTFKSLNAVGLTNVSKDLTNDLFLEE